MPVFHKALQPIDIIESPIQLNQCPKSVITRKYFWMSRTGMIFLTGFPEPFHYSLTIYEIIAYYMLYSYEHREAGR